MYTNYYCIIFKDSGSARDIFIILSTFNVRQTLIAHHKTSYKGSM